MSQTISQKIIKNTIFNVIGRFWGILIPFLLTPYIIKYIGLERYGIWAIVGVITGYFGLLDFGINSSFVKYIAEHNTKKEYEKINDVVNTGIIFYSLLALIIIPLGYFFINQILNIFKIPPQLYKESAIVFSLGIIIFCVSNALAPFYSIQIGLQRMDITNKTSIFISILNVVGTIFFLEKGYGLIGLMINNAIMLGINSIINIIIAYKLLPELHFNPLLFNKEMFKILFKFGSKVQINRIEDIISFQTDKIILAHFLNISLVSFYQLGSSIINKTKEISLLLISAIVPAVSEIDANKDVNKLLELYKRASKYLMLASAPLLTFVFFTAQLIMLIWMGQGYDKSAAVIQILAACYIINIITGVSSSVGLGLGKPEFQMKAGAFQLLLNITLSIYLVLKIGFLGVVIGTFISLSISSIWFLIIFHRYLKYPLLDFLKETFFKPVCISIFSGVVIFLLNRGINLFFIFSQNRLTNFVLFFVDFIMFIAIYCVIILKINYLDSFDINSIKKIIHW